MAVRGNWPSSGADRAIRGMGSKKFAAAVQELVALGYGEVKLEKPLTYSSLREMP